MMSTVIGGAMLPHAPQFFTMPDTEDKAVVAHVREVAADIGRRLRALEQFGVLGVVAQGRAVEGSGGRGVALDSGVARGEVAAGGGQV